MISDSGGGSCNASDYHNDGDGGDGGDDGDTRSVDSDFELTYCEGDVTLMDEDFSDATNEAEKMFLQIVEILRDEQEVCVCFVFVIRCFVVAMQCAPRWDTTCYTLAVRGEERERDRKSGACECLAGDVWNGIGWKFTPLYCHILCILCSL